MLPKITHPIFKITIPSTKKTHSFRPYTVREEKLLVMMQSSQTTADVVDVLKQIITNCCVDNINVDKLALFDIEYIFVKLRSKSVGETIELVYTTSDKEQVKFELNLESVEVKFNPEHKSKFMLYNDIGVQMNYPNFDSMVKLEEIAKGEVNADQMVFDMFIDCIDTVFDDKQVYKDFTKEQLTDFVLNLPATSMEGVNSFFNTMPVLEHTIKLRKKDGSTEDVVLRGLKDFFIF